MYDIAIVDDSAVDSELLRKAIIKVSDNKFILRFHKYNSGEELLEAVNCMQFALIFLDIQMDGMDGQKTAQKLRRIDDSVVLAFYTGKVEPSPEAFIVQPYRYIKKGMAEEEKEGYIYDCLMKMEELGNAPTLTAKYENRMQLCLKPDDIVYLEKHRRGTRIYLSGSARKKYGIDNKDGMIRAAEKMNEMYEILKPCGFGYPHDSYLINFKYLLRCTREELVLEGYEDILFKITRGKALEFNQLKTQFMGEKFKRRTRK